MKRTLRDGLEATLLADVVEAAPDAILVFDPSMRIFYANAHVAELFGWQPDELVGQPLDVLLPERMRGSHESHVAAYRARPSLRPMGRAAGIVGVHRDGHEIPLDIKLSPVGPDGRAGVVAVVRDIGHLVETELQLRSYARQLEALNRQLHATVAEKDRFLGIAAHDLRNPLSAVMAYADMLLVGLVGPLSDEQRDSLDAIRRSAEFMHELVRDLLSLSAIEQGGLELRPTREDLAGLVEAACRLLAPIGRPRGVGLDVDVGSQPIVARIDRAKVEQVIHNLVSNAVRFSPPDADVRVRLERQGDAARLTVADTGPGIPAAERDRIFEPFGRTSVAAPGGGESTGLGLAIARRIVEAHGGHIGFDSERGKGAVFHVVLPLAPA